MKMIKGRHICSFCLVFCLFLNACSVTPIYEDEGQQNRLLRASNVNVQLGMDYLKKNDLSTAKQRFFTALNEAPKNPYVQDALAYFFEVTGDDTNAEYYYKRAISFSSGSGASYNNYGTYLCRKDRYNEAIKQFQNAANNPDYLNTSSAYENAGVCALNENNLYDAQQYFLKALAYSPDSVLSLAGMADLYYLQRNISSAKVYLSRLIKVSPEDPLVKQLSRRINKQYAVGHSKSKLASQKMPRMRITMTKAAKPVVASNKLAKTKIVNPVVTRKDVASNSVTHDQAITRYIVTKALRNSQPNNRA